MNVFMAAATKGAEFLDVRSPNWFDKIDTEILEMKRGDFCILGQLYGTYFSAFDLLGLRNAEMYAYGFNLSALEYGWDNWALLEIAWIQLINERRELSTEEDHSDQLSCGCCSCCECDCYTIEPDETDYDTSDYYGAESDLYDIND